jgi:hypothetical protein
MGFHRHDPPSSHRFDHWGVKQRGQRHPARLGRRASGLTARRLHPIREMRHNDGEGRRVPVAQKERPPTGRQQLSKRIQPCVGHGPDAFPDLDAEEQLALEIARGPYPGEGTASAAQRPRLHGCLHRAPP